MQFLAGEGKGTLRSEKGLCRMLKMPTEERKKSKRATENAQNEGIKLGGSEEENLIVRGWRTRCASTRAKESGKWKRKLERRRSRKRCERKDEIIASGKVLS